MARKELADKNVNLIDYKFYGNSLQDWSIAVVMSLILVLALQFTRRLVRQRVISFAQRTATRLDDFLVDILDHTRFLFLFVIALYFGSQYLEMPPKLARLISHFAVIALLIQMALWGNRAIALWLNDYLKKHRETDAAAATTMSVLGFIARVMLWTILLLMVLANLGFDITALVASLGIGGVAVALALQNILGDIFASLSIAMDKPFVIGDFVIVDNDMGTVEYIGLKTTRVRSLSGEQIIFSNNDLLKSRIHNYKRMYERRVVFGFGVAYETPLEKLKKIPASVRRIIEGLEKTRFDRAHFAKYGDSSLDFEVVYFVRDPDYNLYMDIQQSINLALFENFAAENIQFAYPTRTILLRGGDTPMPAPAASAP